MNVIRRKQTGFTIVELLIVIVVIGILAAITIVAYNGVQTRARDTERTAEIKSVQTALEIYYIDNGFYPSVGTDNYGYALTTLAAALVPTYMNAIPTDSKPSPDPYYYVRGPAANNAYGIRVGYETKTDCHMGMNNAGTNWWGVQAC